MEIRRLIEEGRKIRGSKTIANERITNNLSTQKNELDGGVLFRIVDLPFGSEFGFLKASGKERRCE